MHYQWFTFRLPVLSCHFWFSSIILVNSRCCASGFSLTALIHRHMIRFIKYIVCNNQPTKALCTISGAINWKLNSILTIITKSNYWMHHTHQPYYCHHRSRVRRYHFTNTIIQQYTLFLQLLITSTYRMIITPVSKWSSCVCWH